MPRKYQQGKLEIRRDVKRPYYFVRVTVPKITETGRVGKREPRTLGFVDEITKKEAMQRRSELLEIVNAGRMLVQSQVRFSEVVRRFLEIRVPQLGTATQAKYRGQIAKHILPAFGELRMCDIDRPAVEQWLTAKADAGLGWWTRIDLKGILSGIFTTAKGWKLWEGDNPTEGVRIGRKREVREKRLLSADDMRRLLAALPPGAVRFIVLVIFGTGLRVSEVLGLKWGDIDLAAGTLSVKRRWYRGDLDEPKNEPSKRVRQLGPLADEFVRAYPGPQGRDRFVFLGEDGLTPPDERDLLRYELRPLLKKLGIYTTGAGWHQFRRQNISWRQQAGATPIEAQKSAGHTRIQTTYEYTLVDVDREREQVTAMFDRLMIDGGKVQ
jgi:integrase